MTLPPLRPAQKMAVQAICSRRHTYLYASCGLGKTLTILAVREALEMLEGPTTTLVVAPPAIARLTWPEECRKWGYPAPILFHGPVWPQPQKGALHVVSYNGLQRLRNEVLKGGKRCPFDFIVFDECTFAKNPSSARVNSVRRIFHKKNARIVAMTGTPIGNGLLDVFAQVRLVDNGVALGSSITAYKEEYFTSDFRRYKWTPVRHAEQEITSRISHLTTLLHASDYPELGIPDVVEHVIEVPLPVPLQATYKDLEKQLRHQLADTSAASAETAAALLQKLLQVCCGMLIDDEGKVHHLHDFKTTAVKKLLVGPTVVMATFVGHQDRLRKTFGAPPRLTQEVINDFAAGKVPVLVGHPSNLGYGIDGLQKASNRIVWAGHTWSKLAYDQACSRLARPGAVGGHVDSFKIVCKDTVEERIVEAQRHKETTSESFLDSLRRALT